MNAYAKRIGMKHSHFVNPHGLPAEGHHSTAYDLALLGRALIRDYPESYAYNKIKEFTVGPITQPNRNLLLWRDPSRRRHQDRAHLQRRLLPDGFGQARRPAPDQRGDGRYQREAARGGFAGAAQLGLPLLRDPRAVRPRTSQLAEQKVWKGAAETSAWALPSRCWSACRAASTTSSSRRWTCPKSLVAPIAKGQKIGTVKVTLDGKVIAESPLVALNAVEEGGFFKRLWHEL